MVFCGAKSEYKTLGYYDTLVSYALSPDRKPLGSWLLFRESVETRCPYTWRVSLRSMPNCRA
jgi:hypothetical protein